MPRHYLHGLTGRDRTETANRHLARYLAFVAGASNAGGLLAVGQYTSHMSGIISAMADNSAAGQVSLVLTGASAVGAFLLGAFLTTLMIRWARSRALESEYALPLVAEALLLVIFGFTGRVFNSRHDVLGTVMLLWLTIGLQNAMITKLSNHVIRTTHLTGMVTDVGIALGRIAFVRVSGTGTSINSEVVALRLLTSLVGLFFLGGVIGALGFRHIGFFFTLPLAAGLLLMAAFPVLADIQRRPGAPL